MAKQIVANNGELPPSVTLSVPVKETPNVGAKNIRCLPRSGRACAAHKTRVTSYRLIKQSKGTGAEYDGVRTMFVIKLDYHLTPIFPSLLALAAIARSGGTITSSWIAEKDLPTSCSFLVTFLLSQLLCFW